MTHPLESGQHPLTDEMINEIKRDIFSQTPDHLTPGLPSIWSSDCMRVAYDLAIEHMSQWIEENGYEYVAYDDEYGCQSYFSRMITDFKEAMRPQEDNSCESTSSQTEHLRRAMRYWGGN